MGNKENHRQTGNPPKRPLADATQQHSVASSQLSCSNKIHHREMQTRSHLIDVQSTIVDKASCSYTSSSPLNNLISSSNQNTAFTGNTGNDQSNNSNNNDTNPVNKKSYVDENFNIRQSTFRQAKEKASATFTKNLSPTATASSSFRSPRSVAAVMPDEPPPKKRRKTSLDYLTEPSIHGPVYFPRRHEPTSTTNSTTTSTTIAIPTCPTTSIVKADHSSQQDNHHLHHHNNNNLSPKTSKNQVKNLLEPSIHFVPAISDVDLDSSFCSNRSLRSRNFHAHNSSILHCDENVIITARLSEPSYTASTAAAGMRSPNLSPTASPSSPQIHPNHHDDQQTKFVEYQLISKEILRPNYAIYDPLIDEMYSSFSMSDANNSTTQNVVTPSWCEVSSFENERRYKMLLKRQIRRPLRKDTEQLEETDDEAYLTRHSKYTAEERRHDRLERRLLQEKQLKLKREQRASKNLLQNIAANKPVPKRLRWLKSLCSYSKPIRIINLTDNLPVKAFGEGLPTFKASPYKFIG